MKGGGLMTTLGPSLDINVLTATDSPARHVGDEDLIARRLPDWESELAPRGAYQRWLVEQAVVATVRIDQGRQREDAWRFRQSRRAEICWDLDRRAEVAVLAEGLARKPARVSSMLR